MADWVGCFAVWLCCVRLRAKKRAMAKFICAPYSETINGSSIPATCNVAAVTGELAQDLKAMVVGCIPWHEPPTRIC